MLSPTLTVFISNSCNTAKEVKVIPLLGRWETPVFEATYIYAQQIGTAAED